MQYKRGLLGAIFVGSFLIAACSTPPDAEAPNLTNPFDGIGTTTSTNSDAELDIPHLFTISVPPGWDKTQEVPVKDEWVMVTHGDGCEVQSSGTLSAQEVPNQQTASAERVESIVEEVGGVASTPADRAFIAVGGADIDEPEVTLIFSTARWGAGTLSGFAAARVINTMNYHGEVGSSTLKIRISCEDQEVSDTLIDEVFKGQRVRLGAPEIEPWVN